MILYTPKSILASPLSSPDQITANQNNYAFATTPEKEGGADELCFQRISSDAARTITGVAAKGHGFMYKIANVGSFDITFANQSSSSSAANRLITSTGVDVPLAPGSVMTMVYDSVTANWRCLPPITGGGAGATAVGGMTAIVKAADQTVTSNASPVNDTHFVWAGLPVGTYIIRMRLHFTSAGGGARWVLAGAASVSGFKTSIRSSTTANTGQSYVSSYSTADTVPHATDTSFVLDLQGSFTITVAGSIRFAWAQETSNGGATTLLGGYSLGSIVRLT